MYGAEEKYKGDHLEDIEGRVILNCILKK